LPRLFLPATVREPAGLPPAVDLPGATVGEVLAALRDRWPEVGERVLPSSVRLGLSVSVFLGQEDCRRHGGLAASVAPEDELFVVMPLLVGQ
jgi:molybdopterin converting factor small subunit